MKTLFEQLSPQSQEMVENFKSTDLMDSLHTKHSYIQLNARDLYMMADIFGFNHYNISFASAMLKISELFKR